MNNKNALSYFKDLSLSDIDITSTKINKCNDFSSIDAQFILKYADKDSSILDIASGTGITVNKYYNKVKNVVALEKFKSFSDFIVKSQKIKIINEDMFYFNTNELFDIITMFGIMHYVSKNEAVTLYKKYKNFLKPSGKLLIKQQFGVSEDVIINGYSKELKKDYFSEYRHIDKEIKILQEVGFKNIEKFDIYSSEANRWKNTHFYAIVAQKGR